MDVFADKIRSSLEDLIRDKKALLKILSIAVILLLALILKTHNSDSDEITIETSESETATTETEEISEELCVDISGAVEKPGVYLVESGTRLYELVEMAGGLRSDADINSINQAAFVEDGAKVIIPKANINAGEGEADAADAEVQVISVPESSETGGFVNINTASKEQLKTLSGIGDVMAERIIEYRQTNSFKKKEDIMSVKGIGSATYEKIKDKIII